MTGVVEGLLLELEDAAVDSGVASAAPHETARMLTLGFAFFYGGDWVSVPIEVPVGSRSAIAAVVVVDSFGGRTLVDLTSRLGRPAARARASGRSPARTTARSC